MEEADWREARERPERARGVDSKERWKGAEDGKAKESRDAIKQPSVSTLLSTLLRLLLWLRESEGKEERKDEKKTRKESSGGSKSRSDWDHQVWAWLSRNMRGLSLFNVRICRFNAPLRVSFNKTAHVTTRSNLANQVPLWGLTSESTIFSWDSRGFYLFWWLVTWLTMARLVPFLGREHPAN